MSIEPTFPFGVHTGQTNAQVWAYHEMITTFHVGLFVELGVDQGGLAATMIGRAFIDPDFSYLGVELLERVINRNVFNAVGRYRTRMVIGNCMDPGIVDYVAREIQQARGPALLLCDNGNKPAEVKKYCELLRPGDLLTVHDFGTEFLESDIPGFVNEFYARDLDYENVGLPLWQRAK